ncbi:ATP-binding cassette domain-containing protein [Dactylosporangium sp. NPDC050688]|uniref:ABC transporter ATP-binding protein n=1 Tax=Dactylosporangium sp. NPDC050688 TaxID=3157217 RepID=UPI0033F771E5
MTSTELGANCVGVSRSYRVDGHVVPALVDVDMCAPAGTITAVVGPSGSGKSTLLRLLTGMDSPDHGTITIAGQEVGTLSTASRARLRRSRLGLVRQAPGDNLLAYLTVRQHLRLAAQIRGVPVALADALLEPLGIADRADRLPRQLSGGEQQRVAIAFAAVGPPAVLLADEPTGQLDHGNVDAVVDALRVIARAGVAVIAATHDPAVWQRADRVLRLRAGRVEEAAG